MKFEDIKKILAGKRVAIAGAGGLGSNCAVALARIGVGTLIIADFDKIEKSNLNRQYYFFDQIGKPKASTLKQNIYRINPEIIVDAHDVKLIPANIKELFLGCDVIVEAFDKAEEKKMLIETVLDNFPDTPLVIGSGMAGWGKSNDIKVRQEGNIFICGDELSETSEELPPLAPRVGMVANMQANVVLKLLLKG